MCKLVVSEEKISIENLDKDEVKYLYNMINNAGLLERRIFNELKIFSSSVFSMKDLIFWMSITTRPVITSNAVQF